MKKQNNEVIKSVVFVVPFKIRGSYYIVNGVGNVYKICGSKFTLIPN
jgi:hypothetical protein